VTRRHPMQAPKGRPEALAPSFRRGCAKPHSGKPWGGRLITTEKP
jgi:hypothetical protein